MYVCSTELLLVYPTSSMHDMNHAECSHSTLIAAPVAAKVMLEACLQAAFAMPCPPVSPRTTQLYPDITHSLDFKLTHLDCAASHCWQPASSKLVCEESHSL